MDDILKLLAAGGLAAAALSPSTASAGEVPLAKVPAGVKDTAAKLFKGAKWTSAQSFKEDDGEVFELFGSDAKGHELSIEITDGKVTSVERQIDLKDVPKSAMENVKAKMKAFKPDSALEMHHGDDIKELSKAELRYQLNGSAAKGKDLTVTITADGKISSVKREIELTEVPKSVTEALMAKAPKFKPDSAHSMREDDKLVGYLLATKKGRVAFVSEDGKQIEIHKEEK